MKAITKRLRAFWQQRPQAAIGLIIFVVCFFVYQMNGQMMLISNDNVPHSLLALNWLQNQTLHLDIFRNSYLYEGDGTPYFFIEAPNGHLTSTYPIGTAVVAFPLYVVFFLYLKLATLVHGFFSSVPAHYLDLTNPDFEPIRRDLNKLAATICTALSVVLFYWVTRLKFSQTVSLLITFTYAFATSTWVLNSQDLRQHTVANLLLTGVMLSLFKANRTDSSRAGSMRQRALLLAAGILCGLLPTVRLTSLVFTAAALVYSVYMFRRSALWFCLGLPTLLLHFLWNLYYFGSLSGGYAQQFKSGASSYHFTIDYITQAFFGLLINPSNGFFVYSPVLLFAFAGLYLVFKYRAGKDEQLILCLTGVCLVLFLHYCVYAPWDGGSDSYGCRFMTDTLPVVCFLLSYPVAGLVEGLQVKGNRQSIALFSVFMVLLLFSTGVEAVGAFSKTDWGNVPRPIINQKSRLWSLSDTRIERHFKNLISKLAPPISNSKDYVAKLAGTIESVGQIQEEQVRPIGNPLVARAKGRRVLQAQLKNTGQVGWYGYQTAMVRGETRVRARFFNAENQQVLKGGKSRLFVSGRPQPGETTTAVGLITFPAKPGNYRLELDLVAEQMGDFPSNTQHPPYVIPVQIVPRQ